jgi:hypothetical protein
MKQLHFSHLSFRAKTAIWVILVLLFVSILTLTTLSYFAPTYEGLIGWFVRFHFEAMVLIGLVGIGIGAASFYLLAREIEGKDMAIQSQSQLLLSFLTPLEKECVLFLVKNHGECFQSDLSHLPGMTRLKAHRMVGRLHERKIVHLSSHGKANKLVLAEEWMKGLALMEH